MTIQWLGKQPQITSAIDKWKHLLKYISIHQKWVFVWLFDLCHIRLREYLFGKGRFWLSCMGTIPSMEKPNFLLTEKKTLTNSSWFAVKIHCYWSRFLSDWTQICKFILFLCSFFFGWKRKTFSRNKVIKECFVTKRHSMKF